MGLIPPTGEAEIQKVYDNNSVSAFPKNQQKLIKAETQLEELCAVGVTGCISAFQAEGAGSSPARRSKIKIAAWTSG